MDEVEELSIYDQIRMENLQRHENRGVATEEAPLESTGVSAGLGGNEILMEMKIQTDLLKQIAEKEGLS